MGRQRTLAITIVTGLFAFAPRVQAGADNGLGMAILAAYVKGTDGSLLAKSGATSASRQEKGIYLIEFDRDVSQCFYSVTVNSYSPSPPTYVAEPSLQQSVGDANGVLVDTFDSTGAFEDATFYLLVYCPR